MKKLFKNLKAGLEEAIAHRQGKINLRTESIEILKRGEKKSIKLGNFQDLLDVKFTKEKLADIDHEVKMEAAVLKAMQQNVNDLFESYMKEYNVSLDALADKLHITSRRISKIQKGQINLSLASLALIFAQLGQELVVSFKKR
jgi:DNA-binding Xre family transcriptional regulator